MLEQKHWNSLQYASKIKGFDYFLEKIFIISETKSSVDDFNPFDPDTALEYRMINLTPIQQLNEKQINMDIVFKNNTLNLPDFLRDYLYYHINKNESNNNIKHSKTEFYELDSLLTVYEKQKMESVFLPKNSKSKNKKI